jgi:hypothetical protein
VGEGIVAREQHDFDEPEEAGPRALEDDPDELDGVDEQGDVAEDDEAETESGVEASGGLALDDDDGSDQASLDELLARRAASEGDDSAEDGDITQLSSEERAPVLEHTRAVVTPVREREEFVCKSCHLVKPRVQLADGRRGLCRDCA